MPAVFNDEDFPVLKCFHAILVDRVEGDFIFILKFSGRVSEETAQIAQSYSGSTDGVLSFENGNSYATKVVVLNESPYYMKQHGLVEMRLAYSPLSLFADNSDYDYYLRAVADMIYTDLVSIKIGGKTFPLRAKDSGWIIPGSGPGTGKSPDSSHWMCKGAVETGISLTTSFSLMSNTHSTKAAKRLNSSSVAGKVSLRLFPDHKTGPVVPGVPAGFIRIGKYKEVIVSIIGFVPNIVIFPENLLFLRYHETRYRTYYYLVCDLFNDAGAVAGHYRCIQFYL